MKKSELRSGYLIENDKGQRGIVMLLENEKTPSLLEYCVVSDNGNDNERAWFPLKNIDEDLSNMFSSSLIAKVWSRGYNKNMVSFSEKGRNLLWERKPGILLTNKEASQKLSEIMGREVTIQPKN
jgi:hypothetical protein